MKRLFIVAAVLVLLTSVYSKLVYLLCISEFWALADKFFKVVQNVKFYEQKPFLRNVVFNMVRCMVGECFSVIILGRFDENTF